MIDRIVIFTMGICEALGLVIAVYCMFRSEYAHAAAMYGFCVWTRLARGEMKRAEALK